MIRLTALFLSFALALSFGATNASAQRLGATTGPAEYPPASFTGRQYIDSEGCVFIRAGYGERVTWVPRVTRSRKLVCGFQPTFRAAQSVRSAEPAPAAEPKQRVATTPRVDTQPRAQVRTPSPGKTNAQPQAQTRSASKTVKGIIRPATSAEGETRTVRVIKTSPSGKRTETTRVVRIVRAKPGTQVNTRTQPVKQAPVTDNPVAHCQGASSLSAQYINKGARCGPQGSSHTTTIKREVSPLSSATGAGQYVGPKGSNARIKRAQTIKVPAGYRKIDKDDRYNPLRGVGTASGKQQMGLIWSDTNPRYLIDPVTGKRVR